MLCLPASAYAGTTSFFTQRRRMENPNAGLRSALHAAVEAQRVRLVQTCAHLLEDAKIAAGDGVYQTTLQSNVQMKLHLHTMLHVCRTLLQIAADLSVRQAVSDLPSRLVEVEEQSASYSAEVREVAHLISQLEQQLESQKAQAAFEILPLDKEMQ